MAMRACNRCLENRWAYEVTEGIVTATCQSCAHEVQFAAKKKRRRQRPEYEQRQSESVSVPNPNLKIDPNWVDDGKVPW